MQTKHGQKLALWWSKTLSVMRKATGTNCFRRTRLRNQLWRWQAVRCFRWNERRTNATLVNVYRTCSCPSFSNRTEKSQYDSGSSHRFDNNSVMRENGWGIGLTKEDSGRKWEKVGEREEKGELLHCWISMFSTQGRQLLSGFCKNG